MTEALIIDACRTPRGVGKFGKGALTHVHPQMLGASVLKALAERNNLATEEVDDIIWGTASQVEGQKGDLGRMSALSAGFDQRASGVTLDRFCGSGITSVNFAAASIISGMKHHCPCGYCDRLFTRVRKLASVLNSLIFTMSLNLEFYA